MEQGCEPRRTQINGTQPRHMIWGKDSHHELSQNCENWGRLKILEKSQEELFASWELVSLLCECLVNVLSVEVWKIL